MQSIEKLQEKHEKEKELVKLHRKKMNDLKNQIEICKQSELSSLVNGLNLTEAEFFHFKKLLTNKDTFLETLDVIKKNNEKIVPGDYDPTDESSIEIGSSDNEEDEDNDTEAER